MGAPLLFCTDLTIRNFGSVRVPSEKPDAFDFCKTNERAIQRDGSAYGYESHKLICAVHVNRIEFNTDHKNELSVEILIAIGTFYWSIRKNIA